MWLSSVVLVLLCISAFSTWLREHIGIVGSVVTIVAVGVVYFLVWMRISSVLPRRDVPARALVPGAVLVAVGLQGLHLFTVYYLSDRAERATSLYGAIGAALTLLLWLFIISRLLVAGAVLNAELSQRQARA